MYLTTTISVALVLFLIGLECMVLLSTRNLVHNIKENVALTVVLTPEADSTEVDRLASLLDKVPYCSRYEYISREQALEEHIRNLGEDPEKFLGYNPLTDAYEVYLDERYAHSDSIVGIRNSLGSLPFVDDVLYQEDIVDVLDKSVSEISLIVAVVAVILLLMSLALITNTIRLHIYSKRFLINTMRLVGATPWVIKLPFIRRNLRMGLEAGVVAVLALSGAYWYCITHLSVHFFPLIWQNICMVAGVVLIGGELIAFLASLVATERYVRMKVDRMYEI